jgi:ABC-type transport system involved in multi-copper enzyme maturation permease subunit
VNRALLWGLWRQRLASPIRVVMLGLLVLVPPLLSSAARIGLTALGDGNLIALLFAVGMIGQDVSSGVLQLVLARPVTRTEYVLNRWLAVAIGASIASLAQVAIAWGLLGLNGVAPSAQAIGLFVVEREIQIFGVAGTMALFSSLMSGVADLALYAILFILGGILSMVGQLQNARVVIAAGGEVVALLSPKVDLAAFASGAPPWHALATWASNLTLCLLLAIVVMNRKELSYAAG